jgi:hypothetical protein
LEALRIIRWGNIIELTGWTFEELRAQPARYLRELELFIQLRGEARRQKEGQDH